MKKIAGIATIIAMATVFSCQNNDSYLTDKIGVAVTAEENREYSYTDKQAGYWYGRTHQDSPEWWSGWNMAKKRILADYTLGVDDTKLRSGKTRAQVGGHIRDILPPRQETYYIYKGKNRS